MPIRSLRMICLALLLCVAGMPLHGMEYGSATDFFQKEVEWLADNVEKESLFDVANFELGEIDLGEARAVSGISSADIKPREVGDVEIFNTVNLHKNVREKIRAQLKKIGKHCYVYLQEGKRVDPARINKIVSQFDGNIYPQTRSMLGSEWLPGIDGDPRVTLLLMDIQDGWNPAQGRNGFTAGYFYAGDCYKRSKNPHSNEREMLYLDIHPSEPASDKFLSVIAHEFQHMIHWHHDPKEFSWVNESLSQLAPFLCGYGHPPQLQSFVRNFDNNLAAWSNDDMLANYGQVYLWAYYISIRIASTDDRRRAFVRRMVAQKSQGFSGLNAAIEKQGIKNNVRNLFRNFCVANFLNDERIARGAYGYDKHLAKLALTPDIRFEKAPFEGKSSVKCWSARAVQINPASLKGLDIRFAFSGQKVMAGNYSNSFDVAVVSYSANRKNLPEVNWLNIKDFKASEVLKVSKVHDRMMLIVVNRGPETMKIEQAFAKGARPAAFSFAVRPAADAGSQPRVASTATTRSSRQRTTRTQARSIMSQIASQPGVEDSVENIRSSSDTTGGAAEMEFEFALQKVAEQEDDLIQNIRSDIAEGDFQLVEEFLSYYKSLKGNEQRRLNTLRNRIRDMLRFEQIEGNQKADSYLRQLEA